MAEEYVSTRKKKKRRKKHYLLRLFILAALCVGIYFIAKSQLFDVTGIEIQNNVHYTAEQVVELSGITKGVNLFDVNTREIRDNLLKDPYMKGADIKKKLPGTLVITVDERTEDAAIQYKDQYVLLCYDGMVLRVTDAEPQVTVLDGMTIVTMQPGLALEVEQATLFSDTLHMLAEINDSDMFFKRIDVSNVVIKAYIYDTLVCKGTPENVLDAIKNGDLQAVVYDLYEKGTERGTISVGKANYISFSPEM